MIGRKICGRRSVTSILRKLGQLMVTVFAGFFVALSLYYMQNGTNTSVICIKSKVPNFFDYESTNTRTFHVVCLNNRIAKVEPYKRCFKDWYTKNQTFTMHCRRCIHPQKFITVYHGINDTRNFKGNDHKLLGFKISFKKASELLEDYVVIENQTAYFLGTNGDPFEADNFFHFTKQIYFPLFWLMMSTNQLHSNANNVVFYPRPYAVCDHPKIYYHDIDKYRNFRDILFIKNKLELSTHIDKPKPDKVCYKNAVFSTDYFLDKASEAIDYFKCSLQVRDEVCQPKVLTIINRSSYRRILNVGELKNVGKNLGYDTKVVALETMTWKAQAQLIHCTSVLVGVAGAGLQWAFFMKNYSGVVEIAWPDKEWHFFFTGTGAYQSYERDVIRPLNFVQLNGTCHLYPPAVNIYAKKLFHRETNFTYQQSLGILQDKRNYNYKGKSIVSVGKLCDVTVNARKFKEALISAGKKK